MSQVTLLIAALVFTAANVTPVYSSPFKKSVQTASQKIVFKAKAVGEDSRDMALAALYNRLFQLQDLRRDAELQIEEADLLIGDNLLAYTELDRFVDTVEELKEIARNPKHRRYPNITEKAKLQILSNVRGKLRVQTLAELRIRKIERDIAAVQKLIHEHQNRNP